MAALPFQEHIISDLLEDPTGGLVILSPGLSLHKLISSLISLHHPSHGTLLILSSTSSQKISIQNDVVVYDITSDLPTPQRLSLYQNGAVSFITSRILIVDLLSSRLLPSSVAGILLLNAHSLSPTSTESFIIRLLRPNPNPNPSSTSHQLYVRAFSDNPQSMVSGFAKAEKTLRWLCLRRMHLWPRFHVYVSGDLERDPPEVVDVRVPMTGYMVGIQKAVVEVMDACLKELRKTNKVDVEDLSVESGLFKSFDEIVRRQLDPIWHTLGKKTKQLVADLKTLRKLLDYLVRYDAVTYLKYLDSLRASESFRSVWIFADSSFKIFEYAKKRVYNVGRLDGTHMVGKHKSLIGKKRKLKDGAKVEEDSFSATTSSRVVLEEVLEVAPKWKVLLEILKEIKEEREKQAFQTEECVSGDEVNDDGIVLVVCKDEHSCMQLEECVTNGPQKVMRAEWEKYLLSKVELHSLPKRTDKKKAKDPKGFGVLNGVIHTSGQKAEVTSISKQENDALLEAASELSKQARKGIVVEDDPKSSLDTITGRRKGKSKKASTNSQPPLNQDGQSKKDTVIDEHFEALKSENDDHRKQIDVAGVAESTAEGISADKGFIRKHTRDINAIQTENIKMLPPVHFYATESDTHILDILKPSAIIVYHPNVTFVREIEIYKAENPSKKLKVYFLFYEDSTEVQKFEASIRRENGAFESLIRQKSTMMLPAEQDGYFPELNPLTEPQSVTSQNLITRKAGGRKETEKEMRVIVDMREFMSSLPNVLHQKGMRIIPVTLEVGDYILSPSICIERKSIQDLFGSFASGRLYHQAEMMLRYYRIPVLLIEFSQDKSFSFQSSSDLGDDVTPHNIVSKLSLLALHFPRLRILWSRSLHATAEIFASLKANQDEPDEAKAIRVGVPSEDGIVEDDVRAENYNTSAVEFLRRLPGVTDANYRAIMDGCKSLADLAVLPVERLAEMMGGQKAAKTLRDFLDAKYPILL